MTNKKLFKLSNTNSYKYAVSAVQAAVLFSAETGKYIHPTSIVEVKPLYKYLCWYISDTKTQYIYIIAKSAAQAWYYYCKNGYVRMREHMTKLEVLSTDYEVVSSEAFEVGTILYSAW